MNKKLKILGPYTPEHEGPFCTRDGRPARIVCTDRKVIEEELPILCLVASKSGGEFAYAYKEGGISYIGSDLDLMNAREVPVARAFWVNEYGPNSLSSPYETLKEAEDALGFSRGRTIHVREVLPGEDA